MAACLALLTIVTWYVFASQTANFLGGKSLDYLVLPFLVWAAVRLGLRGATSAMLIVAMVAVWARRTAGGRTPTSSSTMRSCPWTFF